MTRAKPSRPDRPRWNRTDRKSLSAMKAWQVFFVLVLIWTTLAGVVWVVGYDFTAERGYRKLKVCGFARFILPGGLGQAIGCVWWNLAPFYIIPAVALVYAVRKSLTRS